VLSLLVRLAAPGVFLPRHGLEVANLLVQRRQILLDHKGQLVHLDGDTRLLDIAPPSSHPSRPCSPGSGSAHLHGVVVKHGPRLGQLRQPLELSHGGTDAPANLGRLSGKLGSSGGGAAIGSGLLLVGKEGASLGADLGGRLPLLRRGQDGLELAGSVLDGVDGHRDGSRRRGKSITCVSPYLTCGQEDGMGCWMKERLDRRRGADREATCANDEGG